MPSQTPRLRWRRGYTLGALALFAASVTLWFGRRAPYGFPLDEAWLHLTRARQLVEHGSWWIPYRTPQPPLLSPLWTLVLAGAYAITREPVMAVALLAIALHVVLVLGIWSLARALFDDGRAALVAALLAALSGPLLWHAGSGMPTSLLLVCLVWSLAFTVRERWAAAAAWAVAAVLARPDGMLALLPLVFAAAHRRHRAAIWAAGVAVSAAAATAAWAYLRFGGLVPLALAAQGWVHRSALHPTSRWVDGGALALVGQWMRWGPLALFAGIPLGIAAVGFYALCAGGVAWFAMRGGRRVARLVLAASLVVGLALAGSWVPAMGAAGRYQPWVWLIPPLLGGALVAGLGQVARGGRPWRGVAVALAVPGIAVLVACGFATAHTWARAYASNTEHVDSVYAWMARHLVERAGHCAPVVATHTGALTWAMAKWPCKPPLYDLDEPATATQLDELVHSAELRHLAQRHGELIVLVTFDDLDRIMGLGGELAARGNPRDPTLYDRAGRLRLHPIGRSKYHAGEPLLRELAPAEPLVQGAWWVAAVGSPPRASKAAHEVEDSRE